VSHLQDDFEQRAQGAIQRPFRKIYGKLHIENTHQGQVIIRRTSHTGQTILHLRDHSGKQLQTACGQTIQRGYRIPPRGAWTEAGQSSARYRQCPDCLMNGTPPEASSEDPDNYPLFKLRGDIWTPLGQQALEHLRANPKLLQRKDPDRKLILSLQDQLRPIIAKDLQERGYFEALKFVSRQIHNYAYRHGQDAANSHALTPEQALQVAQLIVEGKPRKTKTVIEEILKQNLK